MINVDSKFIIHQVRGPRCRNWATVSELDYQQSGFQKRRLAVMPEYFIKARGYWANTGWHYVAELCDSHSGNRVMYVSLYGGRDEWMQVLADKMSDAMADVFPANTERLPSIYFREVCNVPYDFVEVQRKKDL